jgi:hypothetical protein
VLLAIDPGKRAVGWSLWTGEALYGAGYQPFDNLCVLRSWLVAKFPSKIVIEKPQVYPGARAKGDPNDIVDLAIIVGACASILSDARVVYPGQWKGQVPKTVHHARAISKLGTIERDFFVKTLQDVHKTKQHNVYDAVALGLWALGRLG